MKNIHWVLLAVALLIGGSLWFGGNDDPATCPSCACAEVTCCDDGVCGDADCDCACKN